MPSTLYLGWRFFLKSPTAMPVQEFRMEAKLYVGNLSYQTTEQSLRELFMQAGTVNSVALIKEPGTQRSKGFAFVEMGSPSEVQKAISMFNGYTLDERQLTVNVARPREERSGGGFRQNRRSDNNRRRY
jgi:RNA recognition motif-containing protein